MLAGIINMRNKKPAPMMRIDAGHAGSISCTASKRKGQAFKSPPHPNKRTGTVKGRSASCGRLTMAHRVRGSHGIAAWPTVGRKLDAGRNRDRPIKNRQSTCARSRQVGSISDGMAPKVMGLALQTAELARRIKASLPAGSRAMSYALKSTKGYRGLEG